jgi:hypothetical protein
MQHCLLTGNPPTELSTTIAPPKRGARTVLMALPNGKNVESFKGNPQVVSKETTPETERQWGCNILQP